MAREFWRNRRVFLTGHTGFKGSWLSLWLASLGARVTGYALPPPTKPSLFELARVGRRVRSVKGDVRDAAALQRALRAARPEVVIHMAAQPLVRESYANPAETYRTNVLGTVNLFDAARLAGGVRAVVNVTTDKCYENREWHWAYRENDALGGYDPYSNSKACSELVTASFRSSFFNPSDFKRHRTAVASARAGNVIGGGDWAKDRLIPDCVRTLLHGRPVVVRNPRSVRPWQHVLEPLGGYLALAEALVKSGPSFAEAWNFGPLDEDCGTVESVVKLLCRKWGGGASYRVVRPKGAPHEAGLLRLDHSKARERLGWTPRWRLGTALEKVVEWTEAYRRREDLADCCLQQIEEYEMAGLSDR